VVPEDVRIAVTLPGRVDFFVERVRALGSKEGSIFFAVAMNQRLFGRDDLSSCQLGADHELSLRAGSER
jgi:hypothetical protein